MLLYNRTRRTPRRTFAVMGDSLSETLQYGVMMCRHWPNVLADLLNELGCDVKARNFAKSGNDTSNLSGLVGGITYYGMQVRFNEMLRFGTPDMGVILGGGNDPGRSITTAQTQANLQAMVKWLKFGCSGAVTGQANLPSGSPYGERRVVMVDTATSGGEDLPDGADGLATIDGDGASAQTVWECVNGASGAAGWRRVATAETAATHVSRIIVGSMHYQNLPGTDTVDVPYATYELVREAQAAAAVAEGVVYGDIYNFMRDRIVAGLDADGSSSWHEAGGSQHLNEKGQNILAQAMLKTITEQDGWVDALK